MFETSRRHGHYDTRFARSSAPRSKSHLSLVPALVERVDGDDGIEAWEDEGGLSPAPRDVAPEPHNRLGWEAFCETFFPGRRRHDFEAVKAYEAYRVTGAVPAAPTPDRLAAVAAIR
jgi:hypothetical protein